MPFFEENISELKSATLVHASHPSLIDETFDSIESEQTGRESCSPPTQTIRVDWVSGRPLWLVAENGVELVGTWTVWRRTEINDFGPVDSLKAHSRHYHHKRSQNLKHLQNLYRLKLRQVDIGNASSEMASNSFMKDALALLMQLWHSCYPHVALFPNAPAFDSNPDLLLPFKSFILRNRQWTLLGFQSWTPLTDLRAIGLLGLHCLIYLAKRTKGSTPLPFVGQHSQDFTVIVTPNWVQCMADVHRRKDTATLLDDLDGGQNASEFDGAANCLGDRKMASASTSLASVSTLLTNVTLDTQLSEMLVERSYPWAVAGINVVSLLLHSFLNLKDGL